MPRWAREGTGPNKPWAVKYADFGPFERSFPGPAGPNRCADLEEGPRLSTKQPWPGGAVSWDAGSRMASARRRAYSRTVVELEVRKVLCSSRQKGHFSRKRLHRPSPASPDSSRERPARTCISKFNRESAVGRLRGLPVLWHAVLMTKALTLRSRTRLPPWKPHHDSRQVDAEPAVVVEQLEMLRAARACQRRRVFKNDMFSIMQFLIYIV